MFDRLVSKLFPNRPLATAVKAKLVAELVGRGADEARAKVLVAKWGDGHLLELFVQFGLPKLIELLLALL